MKKILCSEVFAPKQYQELGSRKDVCAIQRLNAEKGQRVLTNLGPGLLHSHPISCFTAKKEITDLAVNRSSMSKCGFFFYFQLIWQSHFWSLFWPGIDGGNCLNQRELDSFTVTFPTRLIHMHTYKLYVALNMQAFH